MKLKLRASPKNILRFFQCFLTALSKNYPVTSLLHYDTKLQDVLHSISCMKICNTGNYNYVRDEFSSLADLLKNLNFQTTSAMVQLLQTLVQFMKEVSFT